MLTLTNKCWNSIRRKNKIIFIDNESLVLALKCKCHRKRTQFMTIGIRANENKCICLNQSFIDVPFILTVIQ